MSVRPHRVQLRRTKGWRMPPNTVKVDRSTKWGNPYVVDRETPAEAVAAFRAMLARWPRSHPEIAQIREQLGGRNLACWCPLDQPCHADVLLEIANGWRELRTRGDRDA